MTISLTPRTDSASHDRPATGLTIRVSRGTGTGSTRLAAFDAALRSAGVADFNLVRLSSVIPPFSSVVTTEAAEQIPGGHGDVLFCVYADAYSSTPGESAWAGVTWAQHHDAALGGLFAEHSGWSQSSVERELEHTMDGDDRGPPAGLSDPGHPAQLDHLRRASRVCAGDRQLPESVLERLGALVRPETALAPADLSPILVDDLVEGSRSAALYRLYEDSFGPLRALAAARHVMSARRVRGRDA